MAALVGLRRGAGFGEDGCRLVGCVLVESGVLERFLSMRGGERMVRSSSCLKGEVRLLDTRASFRHARLVCDSVVSGW